MLCKMYTELNIDTIVHPTRCPLARYNADIFPYINAGLSNNCPEAAQKNANK